MAEVKERCYEALRVGIHKGESKDDIEIIEIVDEENATVLKLDTTDTRVSITSTPGENPLKFQIVISGDDADISTPQIVAGSRLWFGTGSAGEDATEIESFTQSTLEEADDSVTIIHEVEIPEIA